MSSYNIVRLFFLTKLVTIVLRYIFSSLTNQRRSNKATVHGAKQTATKNPSDPKHMEGMHKNVVLSLENKHVVEGTRDSQRHSIRETTLSKRIDKEYSCCSSDWCGVGDKDPGPHSESITKFPFASHVREDTDEKVEEAQARGAEGADAWLKSVAQR